MATPKPNSPEALSGEILAEARRECDEIVRRAQAESSALLATATAEADKIRREKREAAQAEAARRKELALATIPVEAARRRSARIESILENIREEARRRLLARDEYDPRETVVALAVEAVCRLPGNDFILKISAADHAAFGDGLAEEIARCGGAGKTPGLLKILISADPEVADGVMVQTADGFQVWDNRLLSRLERFWPDLRRQIALRTGLVGENETPAKLH